MPSPAFDPAEGRRQLDGDETLLREIIQLFLDDLPKRQADLALAMERRDAKLLERAAHTITGSCIILGAKPAQEASHDLELLGRRADFIKAGEALGRLDRETGRLSDDLRSYLGKPS